MVIRLAPCSANRRDIALPLPRDPPVTRTDLPSKVIFRVEADPPPGRGSGADPSRGGSRAPAAPRRPWTTSRRDAREGRSAPRRRRAPDAPRADRRSGPGHGPESACRNGESPDRRAHRCRLSWARPRGRLYPFAGVLRKHVELVPVGRREGAVLGRTAVIVVGVVRGAEVVGKARHRARP